ncbi:MAG: peptidoglycan editing factor PgeF [Corynebacterium sp.]|nr:peptidoglycan editing factor PgeF [Corynebacterium sp.]
MNSYTVSSWFTDRTGGVSRAPYTGLNLAAHVGDDASAVEANRQLLADRIGVPLERFRFMDQVHSARVAVVDGSSPLTTPATDALVTSETDLPLVVLVADCVPVILADVTAGVVGVAHAGRRGAAAGIVPATVEAMTRLGASVERIVAELGPAAAGADYELPQELVDEVEASLPGSASSTCHGTPSVHLHAGLERQLRDLGVTTIHRDERSTVTTEALYSYRREGTTGRFAGVVVLKEAS